MTRYFVNSENTEDTFDATDELSDAIRIAKEVAQKGLADDVISIEYDGKNIKQFVRRADGTVSEMPISGHPSAHA